MMDLLQALLGEDAQKFSILFITVLVFGGIGGFTGGTYRKRHGIEPSINTWKDGTVFFLCGVISAFGVVALCSGVASFFDKAAILHKGISLVGVSLLSGFFSMRILPHLGARLEKQIGEVKKDSEARDKALELRTEKVLREVEKNSEVQKRFDVFSRCAAVALAAMGSNAQSDKEHAVYVMSQHFDQFREERIWVIIYCRLLHRIGRSLEAISILEEFIEKILSRHRAMGDNLMQEEKESLGTAYFNMACYYNNPENRDLTDKTRNGDYTSDNLEAVKSCLKIAFNYMPRYRKEWNLDQDLANLSHDFV